MYPNIFCRGRDKLDTSSHRMVSRSGGPASQSLVTMAHLSYAAQAQHLVRRSTTTSSFYYYTLRRHARPLSCLDLWETTERGRTPPSTTTLTKTGTLTHSATTEGTAASRDAGSRGRRHPSVPLCWQDNTAGRWWRVRHCRLNPPRQDGRTAPPTTEWVALPRPWLPRPTKPLGALTSWSRSRPLAPWPRRATHDLEAATCSLVVATTPPGEQKTMTKATTRPHRAG
jgi:hypothetical protein